MLILKRNINELVTLTTSSGEHIEVTLIETGYGFARIGFEAPQSVQIARNELLTREQWMGRGLEAPAPK